MIIVSSGKDEKEVIDILFNILDANTSK